jgi:periplasmic protein TonB
MSDNLIEKKFLYLILLSISVHAAVFGVMLNLKEEKKSFVSEPLMVDLEGIPEISAPKEYIPPVNGHAEDKQRVSREAAPKGDVTLERLFQGLFSNKQPPSIPPQSPSDSKTKLFQKSDPAGREQSAKEELFRKKERTSSSEVSSFYPSAEKMALLEDLYRKKYGPEVAEGETKFLNTDDILFGSFLRRFETAVYGVWRYPPEAAKMGIEGVTPIKITFNRYGEIVARELLQSSGSKILDDEVIRALEKIGPVGSFPKGYEKETFNLIAFFHYGITQGATRSLR